MVENIEKKTEHTVYRPKSNQFVSWMELALCKFGESTHLFFVSKNKGEDLYGSLNELDKETEAGRLPSGN